MKKYCPVCGTEIINGQNGASMYTNCFTCKPINYGNNGYIKSNVSITYDELNYLEGRCINDGE